MKRINKRSYPDMDGSPEPGKTYMTKNARINDETYFPKEQIIKEFKSRYGSPPDECFYGKPNGSLLYAGPIPAQLPDLSACVQLSFIPEKESDNGNYYQSS